MAPGQNGIGLTADGDVDVTFPAASGRVRKEIHLRYGTADNAGSTRERITVVRAGSVVATWSRPLAAVQWSTIQSVLWKPRSKDSYSFGVQARDPAGNTRSDCASLIVRP